MFLSSLFALISLAMLQPAQAASSECSPERVQAVLRAPIQEREKRIVAECAPKVVNGKHVLADGILYAELNIINVGKAICAKAMQKTSEEDRHTGWVVVEETMDVDGPSYRNQGMHFYAKINVPGDWRLALSFDSPRLRGSLSDASGFADVETGEIFKLGELTCQ